ncbi:MAG: hypothetical protein U0T77_12905 [Chitinophagales bacterium]
MRNRLLKLLILLLSVFGCSACFDLQENLFFKKDGSGTFSFIVSLGDLKSMMSLFENEKSDNNEKNPRTKKSSNDKLNNNFESTRKKLLKIDGITNVKTIEDTINNKFGLSFNFKNIDVLNNAMNRLFEDDSATEKSPDNVYFQWKDNQLIRNEEIDSKSIIGKSGDFTKGTKKSSETLLPFSLDQLFGSVSYSSSYEFENKIAQSANPNAILSSNMKKVTIKCYPFAAEKDSVKQKCTIANTISF